MRRLARFRRRLSLHLTTTRTQMLGIFVAAPWLALLPAVLFVVLYRRRPAQVTRVAAVTWLIYFMYEEGMRRRILCSGECNIRVDLLLIYPVLLVISALAILRALRRYARRREGDDRID